MFKYSRYINRVTRQPWALLPEKFEAIADLMRLRASGEKLSDEEIAERFGGKAAASSSAVRADGAVAVIQIHGCIAHRADSFAASSGGASTEAIGRLLQRATADDSIKAIILDVDSPGGSVAGVPELAAQISRATAVKPVIAHVNALAASAAYWLASQASEIVCTPSGDVGSIGVYMLLVDESEALAKAGIKINAISAGDNKLEGAPWQALSEESRAFLQAQVDDTYRDFVATVAKGRGVSASDVKKNYGQGRVYDAKTALGLGMIDSIGTFDQTLARVLGSKPASSARMAQAEAPAVIQQLTPAAYAASMTPVVDTSGNVSSGTTTLADDAPDPCETCSPGCPCEMDDCGPDCSTCDSGCACVVKAANAAAEADAEAILASRR